MDVFAQDIDEIVSKRREFLAALAEGPATKPELVARLETSRSTVDRAIDDLERHDFVRRPDDRYELTLAGAQAYQCHETYLDQLADIADASDVMASLSPDVPFSTTLLENAEITVATPHDPHQPLERGRKIISEATRLRQIIPAIFPLCIDTVNERAGYEMELDLVVPSDVTDSLLERYCEDISWQRNPDCRLYELDTTPPYALWVAETPDGTYTGLVVSSETSIRGLIVTDGEEAREWALDQFEQYKARATAVEMEPDRA